MNLRLRRKTLAIIIILCLVFIVFEVYAHTYVHSLAITREEDVPELIQIHINGTTTLHQEFGGCSVDWLVLWSYRKPQPSTNSFYIHLFKTNSSGNLFVQDLEIVISGIETTSKGVYHENLVMASLKNVFYEANSIIIVIFYDIGAIDTYEVNLSLVSKVYAKTLLGYLPVADTQTPIHVTMDYRP